MSQRSQRQPPRDDTSRSVFLVFETNDIYQNVVEYLNPEDRTKNQRRLRSQRKEQSHCTVVILQRSIPIMMRPSAYTQTSTSYI